MSFPNARSDMLYDPVVPVFFRYSIPWTISLLLVSSAGIVDGFFIGRYYGAVSLAALNIIAPVYSLLFGVGIMLASGGGVRCAYYRGQGKEPEAQAMFTKCILVISVLSILVSLGCFIYAEEFPKLLGADAEVLPYAAEYLRYLSPFFPVLLTGTALAYFIRVDERPRLASFGLGVSAATNIVLDYIFVAQLNLGIKGAALATGVGYTSTFILFIVAHFIFNTKHHLTLVRAWGSWKEVIHAGWNGISEMINEISVGTVMLLINLVMMQHLGAYGVAAFTVPNYINWFCLMMSFGMSDSLSPLVSVNNACGLHRRTRTLLITALCSVIGIGAILFVIVSLFPQQLIAIFLPEQSLATLVAEEFMHYTRWIYLIAGANIVLTSYFTGLLQANASAIVAIFRALLFPVGFIIALPPLVGYIGVGIALPLSELCTLFIAIFLLIRILPNHTRKPSALRVAESK